MATESGWTNINVNAAGQLIGLPPNAQSPADYEPITDDHVIAPVGTPEDYKRERQKRGTQVAVAAMLGVHPITIAKREAGAADAPITREAWLAITSLPIPSMGQPLSQPAE
jgi:hypothetical protein